MKIDFGLLLNYPPFVDSHFSVSEIMSYAGEKERPPTKNRGRRGLQQLVEPLELRAQGVILPCNVETLGLVEGVAEGAGTCDGKVGPLGEIVAAAPCGIWRH